MAITIQKGTTTAYFTVQQAGDVVRPYAVNDYDLVPTGDNVHLSLIHKYRKSQDQILIENQPYTNIVNGETSLVFASYDACESYILTNFFNKAGGGSSSSTWGSITGTLSSQTDLQTALDAKLSSVSTDNGITGDGSIATPIKLGGKPLSGATAIDLNGFELDIVDSSMIFQTSNIFKRFAYSNPGITDTNEVQDVSSFQHIVTNNVTSDISSINQADPNSILLQILDGASSNVKQISILNTPNTGIIIVDTKDDMGLMGDILFPMSAGPNQYAQYGNLLTNADNGLTNNSGVVELGGALVVNPTTIDSTGVVFEVHAIGTGLQKTGLQLANDNNIKLFANSTVLNHTAGVNVNCGGGTGHPFITMFINNSGSNKGVTIQDNITGLAISDAINNVGLIGDALFPLNSDSKQYIQVGNIPTLRVASTDLPSNVNSSQTLSYTTGATDERLRINWQVLFSTGTGTVTVVLNWTDIHGNASTLTLGSVNSITPLIACNPLVIKAKTATSVSLNWSAASGTYTYDAAAMFEKIQ